jgi:signal transduction histidine kinase
VDVNALVADIIELMDPPENIHLEVQPGLPTLRTERLPLQQIFMNLIGNAIKHTRREDAQVRIQGRDQDTFYEFVVSDNGPGIAPEFHERIFGIFQTLEARDTVEGTGIGLSLVKKIVEHHSGRVWVESEEGAGSAFHFTWPATP